MKVIQIGSLTPEVRPQHYEVFAREVFGPRTGGHNLVMSYCVMLATGGAEMHTHPESEHVFYVLRGELKVTNGKETFIVPAHEALVIEPNEPHSVTGTGRMDCEYLSITSPPVKRK
jgi:quercetin dioxygenase-like cupin family protein